jgi:glucose/mannose transport system permease protein
MANTAATPATNPAESPAVNPRGPRPQSLTIGRIGLYCFIAVTAVYFLTPLYVMLVTSFKPMEEIRQGNIFHLPQAFTIQPWIDAWAHACTGLNCTGISVGFTNSVIITIPSVVFSIAAGAINGYALSFWKPRGANFVFAILLLGAFVPYQAFLYPLVRVYSSLGLFNTLTNIITVHIIFGLPIMTLLFRNFYAGIPVELFKAARVDGAGFWRTFFSVMLPMSTPIIIVAVILQATNIWNDFLFGLIFAGRENLPMTVQLNNIVNSTQGERAYNVDMAATILTALVPLAIYFFSGRWFVRGIAAGAVKG